MLGKVRVRFLQDHVERVYGYNDPRNPVYKAGEVYTMRKDSAAHWEKRGAAVLVTKTAETKQDDPTTPVPPPPPKADSNDTGDGSPTDKSNKGKTVTRNK